MKFTIEDGVLVKYDKKLTDQLVTVPEGVREIGKRAFYNNTKLRKVILPEGIERIGAEAFYFSELNEIDLPGSVREIGSCAFAGSPITEVSLPEGLEKLEECAFQCTGLREVRIPASVKRLPVACFAMCKSLKRVSIPLSLEGFEVDEADGFLCFTDTPLETLVIRTPDGQEREFRADKDLDNAQLARLKAQIG